jgi:hypothetical protein
MERNRTTNKLIAAVLMLLAAAVPQASAQAARCAQGGLEAGWIKEVRGGFSSIWIQRADKQVRARDWGLLCDGDRIMLRDPDAYLRYQGVDGREVPVEKAQSSGIVEHIVRASGERSAALNSLLRMWERFFPDIERLGVQTISRGGLRDMTLRWSIPSLEQGGQSIAGGARALFVQWEGGIAPFSATLRNPAGAIVARRDAVGANDGADFARSARFALIDLTPGEWRLELTDSQGTTISGRFAVSPAVSSSVQQVRDARGPSAGAQFQELETALDAVALAQSNPGLAFEAVQILASAPQTGLSRRATFRTITCLSIDSAEAAEKANCRV